MDAEYELTMASESAALIGDEVSPHFIKSSICKWIAISEHLKNAYFLKFLFKTD